MSGSWGEKMISIIIPVYNEERRIKDTAARGCAFFEGRGEECELLFVNDGSSDGTAAAIRALDHPRVRDVGYTENRGKGYALRRGAEAAAGEVLLFMDADLAYGFDPVPAALAAVRTHDVVIGSRPLAREAYARYPLPRRVTSAGFRAVVRALVGLPYHDTQCGFKCWRGAAARAVFPRCEIDGFAIDLEALAWAEKLGLTVKEIPAVVVEHGESKVHLLRDSARMFRDALRVRRAVREGVAGEQTRTGV